MDIGTLLFSFEGRLNRAKYWLAVLTYFVAAIILALLGFMADQIVGGVGLIYGIVGTVVYVALLFSGVAVGIKRLHDRAKSGWWLLVFYVLPTVIILIGTFLSWSTRSMAISGLCSLLAMAISIWGFVELGCLRGSVGPNRYGPDPLPESAAPIQRPAA
jgi:uncharacterized membrane protein YhaH (DUF805 family)